MATRDIGNLRTRLSWEDEGATRTLEGFRRDLRGLSSEMNVARSRGREYTQSLKGMREQSDILSRRLRTQQERVRELRRRYEESVKAKGEDAKQTQELSAQYNNAVAQMNRTEDQLRQLNSAIEEQANPWKRLGRNMTEAGDRLKSLGRSMTDFGRSYSMRVTAPIVASGTAVFKAAMDYESAFAGVRKTVDATEAEFADLSQGIRDMAKELPASAVEIAGVAESAGQLGIANEHILSFTRTMIDLGEATNLTSEQAATEFARFANIVGMSQEDFDKLGSVVVELGNNLATTEAEIVSMGMRLAGAGAQIGLTEAEIMSFAAALSSVGIEAEAGGSAFSKVMVSLQLAVERGGDELQAFAKVAGMSSKEFRDAFERDATRAISAFIEGLATAEERGLTAIGILDEMGITEVRMRDALLRAAGASDVFTSSIEMGTKAWQENTALTEEAEQRYKTTESQMRILWNRVKDVAITIGESLAPAVLDAIDAAEPFIRQIESGAKAFREMDEEQQRAILKMIAFAAAIGPVSVGLGGLTTTIGGLLKAGGSLASILGRVGGAGLLGRLGMLGMGGPVGLAVAGVGALGAGIYALVRNSREAREVNLELAESLVEQANTLEVNVARFEELKRESGLTKDEFARLLDITKELHDEQDPEKVRMYQEAYDKLAEKSGLSNDQLDEMIELNDEIIKQSPQVEQSFTDKGNAVVDSTDAVKDYIQSLKDMALEELRIERAVALENEVELRQKIKEDTQELHDLESEINRLLDLQKIPLEEARERYYEIDEILTNGNLSIHERNELIDEQSELHDRINGKLADELLTLSGQRQEVLERIESNKAQLDQLDQIDRRISEIYLSELGINEAGEEGIRIAKEQLDRLKAERDELQKIIDKHGDRSGALTDERSILDEQIAQHESILRKINQETDYMYEQQDGTLKVNTALDEMYALKQRITESQRNTNREIDRGTEKARDMTEELGEDVTKNVDVDDRGTAEKVHSDAEKPAIKSVTLRAAWSGVATGLRVALSGVIPGFAEGTNYHKGGLAVVGEEGPELARHGNRWAMLDFGIVDLPRGTQIFTHEESKKIIRAINKIPAFANGISAPGEADRIVRRLNETHSMGDSRVVRLLQEIADGIRAGQVIVMEERIVGKILEKRISEIQGMERRRRELFAT